MKKNKKKKKKKKKSVGQIHTWHFAKQHEKDLIIGRGGMNYMERKRARDGRERERKRERGGGA